MSADRTPCSPPRVARRCAPLLLILPLLCAACQSRPSPGPPAASGPVVGESALVPLALGAEKIGVQVEPGANPEERRLIYPRGHVVVVRAGHSTWLFGTQTRPVPRPGVVVRGGVMHIPEAMIADLRRDLELALTTRPIKPRSATDPLVRPAAAGRSGGGRSSFEGLVVVIDPGHGGGDPGAIARSGLTEKAVNLAVARRVAARLSARGARVLTTRDDDRKVSLDARVSKANGASADLFVSIHANSAENDTATGVEVLYPKDASRAPVTRPMARAVSAAIAAAVRARDRGAKRDSRGLRVLRATRMPAVLVETGFLSNAGEAARLADPSHRRRIADAIVAGLEASLPLLPR